MCVCENKLRREGAAGVGFPAEKLERGAAAAGRTRASLRGPGREFETGKPSPATVWGAEGDARPKGKQQGTYAEGARVRVWSGLSSFRER